MREVMDNAEDVREDDPDGRHHQPDGELQLYARALRLRNADLDAVPLGEESKREQEQRANPREGGQHVELGVYERVREEGVQVRVRLLQGPRQLRPSVHADSVCQDVHWCRDG